MLFLRSVSPGGLLEKPVTDALSYPSWGPEMSPISLTVASLDKQRTELRMLASHKQPFLPAAIR